MPALSLLLRLVFLSCLITAPLWFGIITRWPVSTDLVFYALILKAFSAQFWAGDFYPHWLTSVNDGLGSPVFVFYPPLTFYIASLWQWLHSVDPNGFGRTLLTMQLAIVASGVTCWRWLSRRFPDADAARGALIYAAFPSLALIIDYDFGVSQLLALAWFPLLLEAAHDLAQRGWRGIPKLVIAYALLLLTHLPSMVVFAGVPPLYAAFLAAPGKRLRRFACAAAACLLAVALAAFYLLPMQANEPYIMVSHFLTGNGDYRLNFLRIRNLVAAMMILLPLLGFFLELPPGRRHFLDAETRFWLAIIAGFMFMTSYLSYPLWRLLAPLHYLQFPWRMLVGPIPAAVYISVRWLPHVKSRGFFLWFSGIVFAINGYVMVAALFFPSEHPLKDGARYELFINNEYQTTWMAAQNVHTYLTIDDDLQRMKDVRVTQGKAAVTLLSSQPRDIVLHADVSSAQASVQLRRFYFPGWQTNAAGVAIGEAKALLTLTLPKGQHDVTLHQEFAGERTGRIISVIALLTLLAMIACSRLRTSRDNPITDA